MKGYVMKYFNNNNNDVYINNAYDKMMGKIIINEGGLGILTGGILGFLAGGPIGAIAGAYIGHKVEEVGVKIFLKNVVAIVGGAFLGGIVAGPLGAIAGGYGGFSIASKESVLEEDKKIDDKKLTNSIFAPLLKNLNEFLQNKSIISLKNAYKSINDINDSSIINKLTDDQKQRIVKIYVFIVSLYELSSSDNKKDRIKFEKIFKQNSSDIIATTVNLFVKK